MLGIMAGVIQKDFSVTLPKTADFPQLQLIIKVIHIPVAKQRLIHKFLLFSRT